ncbi:DUF1579 family protein [Stenomitos frigidus]|uniref:DUF1579 domain-containing protein n=1 Tax=Stenomitos frigidus ULC18 TaxID=2107698 RepID=A0A2T1E0H6_9CYAN|nr:DUF1579 family protein [Stenomitos frigidus]PSB26263.1 hypothetical protein C7B82_20310 [Stenomitos frigidus ULC18]
MPQKTIETKNQSPEPPTPSNEHKQLGVWVGKWSTEGQSYAEGNSNENLQVSSVKMTSVETFELLLDGFFLVHRWDGRVGGAEFKGMEVIGYDASSQTYCSRFFDNAGNTPTYQVTVCENVWTYIGELQRATFEFSDDGNTMTTHWDWKKTDSENWLPLCDLKVTKVK